MRTRGNVARNRKCSGFSLSRSVRLLHMKNTSHERPMIAWEYDQLRKRTVNFALTTLGCSSLHAALRFFVTDMCIVFLLLGALDSNTLESTLKAPSVHVIETSGIARSKLEADMWHSFQLFDKYSSRCRSRTEYCLWRAKCALATSRYQAMVPSGLYEFSPLFHGG